LFGSIDSHTMSCRAQLKIFMMLTRWKFMASWGYG